MPGADVEAAITNGRVPSGISASYLNESRDTGTVVAITIVFALATLVVSGRFWARITMLKRFGLDDILAVLAWTLLVPFVGLCYKLILIGSGRHYEYIQYVMLPDVVDVSEVYDFAAHIIYTTSLLVCRLSGLALYATLVKQHHTYILALRTIAAFIVLSYLPQLLLIIFHCLPVTGLWPYAWQLPAANEYTCLTWGVVYSMNSAVSLCSDLLLYGVPAVMIWQLQLPRRRKVQLACILCPGVLVISISIARLILVIQGQWLADESWQYNPLLAIEVAEISFTLISLSIPGCKLLFDKYIGKADVSPTGATYTHGNTRDKSWHATQNDVSLHDMSITRARHSRNNSLSPQLIRDDASTMSTAGILAKTEFQVESVPREMT